MPGAPRCHLLPWDSEFFGVRIARLDSPRLRPAEVGAALQWCRQNAVDCLYFLADAEDAQTGALAATHGFQFVDLRLTLHTKSARSSPGSGPGTPVPSIRTAAHDDLAALQAIAAASHHDSRFYFDPHFAAHRCDTLYETWIKRSLEDAGGAVFVAEVEGQPAGYISCQLTEPGAGQIGLFAVAHHGRGQGLGTALIRGALEWCHDQGAHDVFVVTQGRNVAAQRVYQRAGFRTQRAQVWYHRWFTNKEAPAAE